MPISLFVGRDAEVSEALELLHADEGMVMALVGMHGMGKTAFLERVLQAADGTKGLVSVPIVDMATIGDAWAQSVTQPEETVATLFHRFDHSQALMRKLAQLTGARDFAPFYDQLGVERQDVMGVVVGNQVEASRSATVTNNVFTANIRYDEGAASAFVLAAQKRVDDSFVDCWSAWCTRARMLIAVDHFELVAATDYGRWILEMALRLDHLVTLVACLPAAQSSLPVSERVRVCELPPFSVEETAAYLETRFAPAAVDRDLAKVTQRFTDGHPGGTKLVADLINERQIDEATELGRTLDRLPEDPAEQWKVLVRLILQPLHESLLDAVDACAVTTTFNPPLLSALLGRDDRQIRDATEILHGYGFIRRFETPQVQGQFGLREFIRQSVARSVRHDYPTRWQELHARAVVYYADELDRLEEDGSADYSAWYRYEDPYWQWCKAEWLFHSSQLRDGRELTRARLVLVFLEAFYWWGCYQPFLYNRTLLYDWSQTARAEEVGATGQPSGQRDKDDQLLESLTFILDRYPVGHIKTSDDWDAIFDELLTVQRLCGLGQSRRTKPLDERAARDLARTNVLIRVFLADTQRYRSTPTADAARYYNDALDAFRDLDDGWMVAWLLFELGDLALDRDRVDQAQQLISESANALLTLVADGDDWDPELIANLFRARGDVEFSKADFDAAFAFYGRAIQFAYRFQGYPHAPDDYTQRFYAEITDRVTQRLMSLADTPRAAKFGDTLSNVLAAGTDRVDGLDQALTEGDPATVKAMLFPAGPEDDELKTDKSRFLARWERFYDSIVLDTDAEVRLVVVVEPIESTVGPQDH